MIIGGEKHFDLTNGDSLVPVTNEFHNTLEKALDVVGETRHVHITLTFTLEG